MSQIRTYFSDYNFRRAANIEKTMKKIHLLNAFYAPDVYVRCYLNCEFDPKSEPEFEMSLVFCIHTGGRIYLPVF